MTTPYCCDRDGDGYANAMCGGHDCRDDLPAVHPGAVEDCSNGVDDDCNGQTDCNDLACSRNFACCVGVGGTCFFDENCCSGICGELSGTCIDCQSDPNSTGCESESCMDCYANGGAVCFHGVCWTPI